MNTFLLNRHRAKKDSPLFKKVLLTAAATLIAVSSASSASAQVKLFDDRLTVNFYAAQGYQAIQAKEGAFRPIDEEQSANFLRLRANLELSFQVNDHIRAYVDIAEEPNDFANGNDVGFTLNQDFGGIDFELLGLTGNQDDNKDLILSLGNIGTSPFQFKGFQDGAASQGNPLIGNSPVDFATAESGAQLSYTQKIDEGFVESFNLTGAITGSSFGEAFQPERGFNARIQGTLETSLGIDVGVNYLKANQGDQVDISGTEVASLDGLVFPGFRFGDGENYNFTSSDTSSRETHVGLLPGLELEILQLNVQAKPTSTTTLIGMVGMAQDDFSFVDAAGDITANQGATGGAVGLIAQDSEIFYYVAEGTQYIVPEKLYVAGRYTSITNNSPGITTEDNLTRIQVAAGYWLNDKTLLKVEYVDQTEDLNSGGQIGGGFDGFSSEISIKF